MKSFWRGLRLVLLALAVMVTGFAVAQVPTTTVQDTVYRADGTAAGGSVIVSWNAFTTAGGSAVPAGSKTATIGAGGVVSIALAANAGATPMGSYYTAVFHLNDGTVSREYWVVPAAVPGGGPVPLAAIQNQVLPASVAMQTVSKQYVDAAIASAAFGFPLDASPYVQKAGDTMTGPLVLPADPVTPNQAATKNYVDANVASISGGSAGKVALLPSVTQVVTQPVGTQLETSLLNGEVYATQYVDSSGHGGIVNALASADCASGCKLIVEPTFPGSEPLSVSTGARGTHQEDKRGGAELHVVVDPYSPSSEDASVADTVEQVTTRTTQELAATSGVFGSLAASTLYLRQNALTGGTNQLPMDVETTPYFKATYSVLSLDGEFHTLGQHITQGNFADCYSVGDCIDSTHILVSSGGYRDLSDEGTHTSDDIVEEDERVFTGTCGTGCTAGSTSVTVTGQVNGGTQGDGRYLMDTNPAKAITAGTLTGGDRTIFGTATFSGTSFPVSVFLSTVAAATSQPHDMAPGSLTVAITTSGVTAGFATNTAALPASSGIACVADPVRNGGEAPDFEMAPYSVVDATHLQMTLAKVHNTGATIAVGGLCGYGLEQKVDTFGTIRQVFPVVGSTSATGLYYADGATTVVGRINTTGGFVNAQFPVAAIARSGGVVTLTMAGTPLQDLNALTLTVSGVADASYNGSFVVTSTAANVVTYASAGPDSTSSGGTIGIVTGAFGLYPMAEVLSVYNAATKQVDGTMTLGPNTVAWAAGDAVEEPHYFQQNNNGDIGLIEQRVPRPITFTASGRYYQGTVGQGVRGWEVGNQGEPSQYYGAGGTHYVPDAGVVVSGAWDRSLDVEAGVSSVLNISCNLHGCGKWNSGYALMRMQAAVGIDSLNYAPQSNTATMSMGGAQYVFSPTAFTASAITVGTLNATTITGGVSGAAITSGTIAPARLPLFGPSGTTHAVGAVPDPGATAGNTRYLREDGTWSTPAGGGGFGGGALTVSSLTDTGAATIAGTLGVGTTTPATQLDVVASTGVNLLGLQNNNPSAYSAMEFRNSGGARTGAFGFANSGAGTFTNDVYFTSIGNMAVLLAQNLVPRILLDTSGKIELLAPVTAESVSSGSATNTDLVGTLVLAAGSTTSASYAFSGTYASAPVCVVQPQSATPSAVAALNSLSAQVTATGLSVAVGSAPGAAVTFGYVCAGRN